MRLSLRLPVNLFPIFLNLSRGCMEPVSQDVLTVFSLCSDRAVYFACYSKAKEQFNGVFVPNSNIVHIFSAGSAGVLHQ